MKLNYYKVWRSTWKVDWRLVGWVALVLADLSFLTLAVLLTAPSYWF